MIDGPEYSKMLLRWVGKWVGLVTVIAVLVFLAIAAFAGERPVLVVTLCSQASGQCEDRRLPLFDPAASALGCMLQAPAIMADRSALDIRGDQQIARWRCA